MLKSSLTIWWGAATFAIEVIGLALPTQIISFNKIWLLPLLFIVSLSLFIGVTVLYKGWNLYSKAYEGINVAQIIKIENEQVFLLKGLRNICLGSILEIRRVIEGVNIPIGFIELTNQNDNGMVQAKPIWIMPGHLRDIETHSLSAESLLVSQNLSKDMFQRWLNESTETRVNDLIKRGTKS